MPTHVVTIGSSQPLRGFDRSKESRAEAGRPQIGSIANGISLPRLGGTGERHGLPSHLTPARGEAWEKSSLPGIAFPAATSVGGAGRLTGVSASPLAHFVNQREADKFIVRCE